MALETGTYISDLNSSNPVATDGLAQADDHIRLVKSTIKATLPGLTGAVTSTHTELNTLDGYTGNTADLNILSGAAAAGVTGTEVGYLDGVTSALQTQLNSLASTGITISAGGGLTGGGSLAANRTISHSDTSSQSSVNNSNNTVIQDISVDTYGHVTSIGSKALSIPSSNSLSTGSGTWTDGSGGLQIRFGTVSSTSDGAQSFSFTTAFSSACLVCVVGGEAQTTAVSRTGFTIDRENDYNGTKALQYIALGY